ITVQRRVQVGKRGVARPAGIWARLSFWAALRRGLAARAPRLAHALKDLSSSWTGGEHRICIVVPSRLLVPRGLLLQRSQSLHLLRVPPGRRKVFTRLGGAG